MSNGMPFQVFCKEKLTVWSFQDSFQKIRRKYGYKSNEKVLQSLVLLAEKEGWLS